MSRLRCAPILSGWINGLSSLLGRRRLRLVAAAASYGVEPLERRVLLSTFTPLVAFTGATHGSDPNPLPGANPFSGVVLDSAGDLFGTTPYGGTFDDGTVFELTHDGFFRSYSFNPATSGSGIYPRGLILDSSGVLYGTCQAGGDNAGDGTIFKLTGLDSTPTMTTLATFDGNDGSAPYGGLAMDANGNLYGTTLNGGTINGSRSDFGTVFELVNNQTSVTPRVIFNGGTSGGYPYAGVVLDPSTGNLFGTTEGNGTTLHGTVFELSGSTFTTLFDFGSSSSLALGAAPNGTLVMNAAGDLFGTTTGGGNSLQYGTVFEISHQSIANHDSIPVVTLATFTGADGALPWAGVVIDNAGNLYGTTQEGGDTYVSSTQPGAGTLFKLTPGNNNTWSLTKLYSFQSQNYPNRPLGGLAVDPAGNLYGTTYFGNPTNNQNTSLGTVFSFGPSAATVYHLAFVQQPTNAVAGHTISPAVTVEIDDQNGTRVTNDSAVNGSSVTLAIASGPNGTLSGTATATVGSGLATFSNLSLNINGSYTLGASDSSYFPAVSNSFVIGLPVWLDPNSVVTWNSTAQTLAVTGTATIIADPQSSGDLPIIQAAVSAAALTVHPNNGDTNIHIASLSLSNAATANVYQTTAPDSEILYLGSASSAGSLSIDSSSQFDLGNNMMLVNYATGTSPITTIVGYLRSGYNSGAWNGHGIISGAAAANPMHRTGIGYADSADGTGVNTTANSILLKYTLYGDTDLNKTVNFTDFSTMAANYNMTGKSWDQGDFSYEGSVDFNDFSLLAANYGVSLDLSAQQQMTFAAGSSSLWITSADVNGDGNPDLVLSNQASGSISVLLGNGDGTFKPQTIITVGAYPEQAVIADVNGDGKPDIIVALNVAQGVGVLLGNGNGTFQAEQTFAAGGGTFVLSLVDVNHDSKLDIVTSFSTNVSVLLGNGNGTFQSPQTFAAGASGNVIRHLAAADVNGDGNPDLVVNDYAANTVNVLLGNGDGTFQARRTFAAGSLPFAVAVRDVNGDGKADLVVANVGADTLSVLLGNGNGTFQAQSTLAVGATPREVQIADINGDGKPDLIVVNYAGPNVGVLLGNGDGTFQAQKTFQIDSYAWGLAISDVNGDGRPDIIVANNGNDTISVILNTSGE